MVCSAFDVPRSCYYDYRVRRHRADARRVALRSQVSQLFSDSRGSAGSRSIMSMMREQGVVIGRFRVRRLMRELGLVSKQPGPHAYKQATVERPDIPNLLNREFTVERPNQVWSGVVTLPTFGLIAAGITWRSCWICMHAAWWAGRFPTDRMPSWRPVLSTWRTSSVADRNR